VIERQRDTKGERQKESDKETATWRQGDGKNKK
jgi:hypothetical protein